MAAMPNQFKQLRKPRMSSAMQVAVIAVGIAAAAVSYHALRTSQDSYQVFDERIGAIERELQRAQERAVSLNAQLAALTDKSDGAAAVSARTPAVPTALGGDPEVFESLVNLEGAVSRLEEIVDVSGVENMATNQEVDPDTLKAMVGEYSERRRAQENRDSMRERFQVSIDQELERHGDELHSLFERARMRFGRGGDEEDRQAAFDELQEKYPDSYAAAVALGEYAIGAAFRRDVAAVEQYHQQLQDHKYGTSVATEWGIEVTPSLEYYLANQYIRDGQYDKAQPYLESLEENYGSSYVFTTGRRRRSPEDRFQPVSRAVSDLRASMPQ